VRVILDEVTDIDAASHRVVLRRGELRYDTLVVATGAQHHYFGNPQWETVAPGLKTIEDATEIRKRILLAFEEAEREEDPEKTRSRLTFVVVGGGPTGVELAGALGEIANDTLRHEFRSIDPANARVLLLEGNDRILPSYPHDLSSQAVRSLERLGVTVQTNTVVTEVSVDWVKIRCGNEERKIPARTVLWAAGVAASPLGRKIAAGTGVTLDKVGRVVVEPDLTVKGHPEIFVIGDLANFPHQTGTPLPGVAPVAMQQGRYVARVITRRLRGEMMPPFVYRDKGSLATIGRAAAVADFGRLHFSGYFAWLIWLFVHLMYIVEFENRLLVFVQWAWNYFTRNRAARLITGKDALPRF
jgi:NADH:ubiquinone reductase (H+-translocating)